MKLTEGGRLERPNLCWICERTPEIGTPVIDTERYFDGHPFNLQGRRYVCSRCVHDMVKHFGFVSAERVRLAEQERMQAEGIIRGIKQKLDVLMFEMKALAENPGALIVEEDSVLDIPEISGDEVATFLGAVFGGLPKSADESAGGGDSPAERSDSGSEGGHRAPFEAQ